mgnify:FL=1
MTAFSSSGQSLYEAGKVGVIVIDPSIIPSEGEDSENQAFNQVLIDFEVSSIERPMYFAKTPELRRYFELTTPHNEDSLFQALTNINNEGQLFLSIEKIGVAVPLVSPSDYMYQLLLNNDTTDDWIWYLNNIEASKAWDITKGDSTVRVYVREQADFSHPDLTGKMSPNFDIYDSSTVFNPTALGSHGTAVSSLAAGETTDSGMTANGQLASIGYNTKMIYSSWRNSDGQILLKASTVYNADVINLSWFMPAGGNTTKWRLVEDEVLGNGTIVIRGAGNGFDMFDSAYANVPIYPFNGKRDDRVIVVSSTDRYDNFDPYISSWNFHSHYPEVDLCAPGHDIIAATATLDTLGNPISWPYTGWRGTSFASPITSGTAALMKSVNPCLTSNSAQDILKNTTDPIADANSFPGVIGTGRLNAYKAVKAAQGMYSSEIDLFIKDRPEDFGYPGSYAWGWWFDKSPDIWLRNQPDGFTNQIHQEPNYANSDTVYVYVRVWNKSCDSSNGDGNLSLYWTKASSSSSWPQNWDGSQPTVGNLVGTQSIPNIKGGESQIFEFKWHILNPYIYSNWASCLLARIEDIPTDSITVYPNHLEHDVYYNNNVAMRNVTIIISGGIAGLPVIDGIERPHGRFMFVGNSTDDIAIFDIDLEEPLSPVYGNLTEEAEVRLFTDDEGWSYLGSVVEQHPDIEVVGDKEFLVLSPSVTLSNIQFPANTRVPLYVGFSFLTDEQTSTEEYYYRVSQQFSNTEDHITGAEHFVVRKTPRTPFDANAGYDQQIQSGDSTMVNADDILEPAFYHWYDPEGNLIYSGKDATVTPAMTTTYKLEVVANTDGFKDYDEVTIEVQNHWIESISPNPAISTATIDYHLEQATSAYLMVLNSFGTISNNYILTVPSSQTTIDFSNYTPGVYNIVLVVNGEACDSKSLVIQ